MFIRSMSSLLRGDSQPTLLSNEFRSPDQVPQRSKPIFDQTPKSFDFESDGNEEKEEQLKCSKGV